MNTYKDIHSAYLGTLADVLDNPDYRCAPRGQAIREKLDYKFTVNNPTAESIVTLDPQRNAVIADYTAKETALYDSCSNLVSDFEKASKFWSKLANPDGTINSAYGYLIWGKKSLGNPGYELHSLREKTKSAWASQQTKTEEEADCFRTPWEWCVESLKRDKDTRQAVLRFSLPEHHWIGTADFVCTMHGNFLIRENKLYFSIVMRSNDLFKGLVYDFFWFVKLMDDMLEELRDTYPDLQKGSYTHMAHSIHIYDRDEETIKKMLGR